jgi:hypothetical protein
LPIAFDKAFEVAILDHVSAADRWCAVACATGSARLSAFEALWFEQTEAVFAMRG